MHEHTCKISSCGNVFKSHLSDPPCCFNCMIIKMISHQEPSESDVIEAMNRCGMLAQFNPANVRSFLTTIDSFNPTDPSKSDRPVCVTCGTERPIQYTPDCPVCGETGSSHIYAFAI